MTAGSPSSGKINAPREVDISVIVSQVLPKNLETFDVLDGVWVENPKSIIPVATVLRHSILEVGKVRLVSEGQQTKTELVYQ